MKATRHKWMHAALTCGCKAPCTPGEAPAAGQNDCSCSLPDAKAAPLSKQRDQAGHGTGAGHHQWQVASSGFCRFPA